MRGLKCVDRTLMYLRHNKLHVIAVAGAIHQGAGLEIYVLRIKQEELCFSVVIT